MSMKRSNHAISGVFVFLLLGMFAAFGTMLVLLGAQAYRSIDARTAANGEARLLQSFVRHAVQAQDEEGCITVREEQGFSVLCIADENAPDTYATFIYVYDGSLYEQYAEMAEDFEPARGDRICSAAAMTAVLEGQRLTVEITAENGQRFSLCIALHAGEVGL